MPGTSALADRCASLTALGTEPLVCSREALAHVLRSVGYEQIGNLIGLAAFLALPSVVLLMLFGQTRIFFVMARASLLPANLARSPPRWNTPPVVTTLTCFFFAIPPPSLPPH